MSVPAGSPSHRLGFALIALSAVIFGTLGVTVKGVLNVAPTNALSITLLRALIALPVLVTVSVILLGRGLLRIAAADLGVMIVAGLMMALYQVGFVIAMGYVGVAVATLITLCTVPLYAVFLGRALLGERLHASVAIALVCAVTGVALLVGFRPPSDTGAGTWLGVGLALLTGLGYALFQVCGRVLANRYHPLQTLSVFFLVAALALLPVTLTQGFVTAYPPVGWLLLAHLSLGITVLAYVLLLLGLRTTRVSVATIVGLLEPLTGAGLAWLLLGERLSASGLLGAALLLGAMGIVFRVDGDALPDS
jgi:DME family drug/metabolite transporter